MALINYEDKVALNINPSIPDFNKVNASDMNEIKNVVNANANTLNEINTNLLQFKCKQVTLNANSSETFDCTTRSTIFVMTSSNSGVTRGFWLVQTNNTGSEIVKLSSSNPNISISSNGTTLTITNNSAYGTNVTVIYLATR